MPFRRPEQRLRRDEPGARVAGNRIFSNQGLEIDLGETNAMNFGVMADGVDVTIGFNLHSEAARPFTLEFFHTGVCDASGHGGAETVLGTSLVNTDSAGNASGQVTLPLAAVAGFITTTATNDDNGTSEFSLCAAVQTNLLFRDGFEDLAP